ncbi:MAG TPA: ABC transporter permease, partial [Terriglobia bacterium]|nr:ABC transporter permease [Terriglobia bacterium]
MARGRGDMNWEHLRAFLWLQSRINANKTKRMGGLTVAIHSVLWVLAVVVAAGAFAGFFSIGFYLLGSQSAVTVMYVWDGVVGAFLFFWLLMLSMELQRSELLPIEKFLHYPASISSLFLINFVASIINERLSTFFFLPAMLGLSLGLSASRGAAMLWLFPLTFGFLLMVTAVTHQFRGWLAVIMMNKRHRRNVIAIVTFVSIAIFQLPGLSSRFFTSRRARSSIAGTNSEQAENLVTTANMVLPIGWLPYGARAASEGRYLAAALGFAGMTLIGALSLRRSYRTTMRLYTGNYGSGKTVKRRTVPAPRIEPAQTVSPVPGKVATSRVPFMELKFPRVSEQASAVAVAAFRSMMRAPESKMVLISPVILLLFFGTSILRMSVNPSEFARPLMATAVLLMILFGTTSLGMNQFAFDRSGFRNFVLSSVSRREILLGKNLAMIPVTLGLAVVAVILFQYFVPMRIDHFIAVLMQMITMYLLDCLYANFLSIVNPHAVASGSLRPAGKQTGKMFLYGLLTFVLFPMALAPSMIPLGAEYLFHLAGWYSGVPVFFL